MDGIVAEFGLDGPYSPGHLALPVAGGISVGQSQLAKVIRKVKEIAVTRVRLNFNRFNLKFKLNLLEGFQFTKKRISISASQIQYLSPFKHNQEQSLIASLRFIPHFNRQYNEE
jgi:hypothetical protein